MYTFTPEFRLSVTHTALPNPLSIYTSPPFSARDIKKERVRVRVRESESERRREWE